MSQWQNKLNTQSNKLYHNKTTLYLDHLWTLHNDEIQRWKSEWEQRPCCAYRTKNGVFRCIGHQNQGRNNLLSDLGRGSRFFSKFLNSLNHFPLLESNNIRIKICSRVLSWGSRLFKDSKTVLITAIDKCGYWFCCPDFHKYTVDNNTRKYIQAKDHYNY